MKASTLNELKQELTGLEKKQLVEICLRLGKLKKENKELLTYLLFEANDEDAFIRSIKLQTTEEFMTMNSSNLYLAKKSIRKILRTINKYSRYSGIKQTEVELRIHFCRTMEDSGITFRKSPVLCNLYNNQLTKIEKALSGLHEDLQFDFRKEMSGLNRC